MKITVTYSHAAKTFCVVSDDVARIMLVMGNPYGHNRAKRFVTVEGAQSVMQAFGFKQI